MTRKSWVFGDENGRAEGVFLNATDGRRILSHKHWNTAHRLPAVYSLNIYFFLGVLGSISLINLHDRACQLHMCVLRFSPCFSTCVLEVQQDEKVEGTLVSQILSQGQ